MPVKLTPEARGFRDLYWCSILNEPVILTYQDNKTYCTCCEGSDIIDDGLHEFVGHIALQPPSKQ